jgi:hypothetical protein
LRDTRELASHPLFQIEAFKKMGEGVESSQVGSTYCSYEKLRFLYLKTLIHRNSGPRTYSIAINSHQGINNPLVVLHDSLEPPDPGRRED